MKGSGGIVMLISDLPCFTFITGKSYQFSDLKKKQSILQFYFYNFIFIISYFDQFFYFQADIFSKISYCGILLMVNIIKKEHQLSKVGYSIGQSIQEWTK